MVSSKLRNNLTFWQAFPYMTKRQKKAIVNELSKDQVADLEEICVNILNGNISCDKKTITQLKRKKKIIKDIGDRKLALKYKKQVLQKGNGITAIALLMSTVLPIIADIIRKK